VGGASQFLPDSGESRFPGAFWYTIHCIRQVAEGLSQHDEKQTGNTFRLPDQRCTSGCMWPERPVVFARLAEHDQYADSRATTGAG